MGVLKRDLAEYLYNRLPRVYRSTDDEEILKRFIDVFVEGGYNPLLEEASKIMDLLDVDKCPSKFLPYLCKMYGYEYTLEIPELFQRRLLKYIVDMYKRKGTKSVVRFIARELTGFESEVIENKDFDRDLIELTKWDKRFEHYRNFVLKLTAPFEDSSLYNKENIVVKIVNDFIPTNSQVFVITAYWFREESTIVKNSFYDMTEFLEDYKGDFRIKAHVCTTEQEVIQCITDKMHVESHMIFGEEIARLNSFLVPLHTNALLKVKDIVKFNPVHYSKFLKALHNNDTKIINSYEGHIRNNLNKYLESRDTHKIKDRKMIEVNPLNNYGFTKHDTIYALKHEDGKDIRVVSREYDRYYKIKDKDMLEILEKSKMRDILNSQRITDFGMFDSKTFEGDKEEGNKLDTISFNTLYYNNFLFYKEQNDRTKLTENILGGTNNIKKYIGELVYTHIKNPKYTDKYINKVTNTILDNINIDEKTFTHIRKFKILSEIMRLKDCIESHNFNGKIDDSFFTEYLKLKNVSVYNGDYTFSAFDKLYLEVISLVFTHKFTNEVKDKLCELTNATFEILNIRYSDKLKLSDKCFYEEVHKFFGEEVSTLNKGMKLYTNALLNLLDYVQMREFDYEFNNKASVDNISEHSYFYEEVLCYDKEGIEELLNQFKLYNKELEIFNHLSTENHKDILRFHSIIYNITLRLSESLDGLRNKVLDEELHTSNITFDSFRETQKNVCEDILTLNKSLGSIKNKITMGMAFDEFNHKITNSIKDKVSYLDLFKFINSSTFSDSKFNIKEQFESISYLKVVTKLFDNLDYITIAPIEEVKGLDRIYYYPVQNTLSEVLECMYINGTISKKCDIIKASKENCTLTLSKVSGDNSKLNVNLNLYTNGLYCFDIVREQNEPPKLILL